MSATPEYLCTQAELKARAWESALAMGFAVALLLSAVLGIALMLGANIPTKAFVGTVLIVAFIVIGIARLMNQIPSPAELKAMREIDENGGGRLRGGYLSSMRSREERFSCENAALRQFVQVLGFDADKVIEQLSDNTDATCKNLSLCGLKVVRDFSDSSFSPAGINAANKWLDELQV